MGPVIANILRTLDIYSRQMSNCLNSSWFRASQAKMKQCVCICICNNVFVFVTMNLYSHQMSNCFKLQLVSSFTSEDVTMERLEYRNNDNSSLKVKGFIEVSLNQLRNCLNVITKFWQTIWNKQMKSCWRWNSSGLLPLSSGGG